ncbi:dolichol-phosphate mannosyltransferase subunit 3-domain-containing protein, partial [Butyriboletus roseoflavus]
LYKQKYLVASTICCYRDRIASCDQNRACRIIYACGTFQTSSCSIARAQRVAVYASAFLLVYLFAFFSIFPVSLLEPDIVAQLLPISISWWLLVCFGAYSLASLSWGLFTFQDCPNAYHELLKVTLLCLKLLPTSLNSQPSPPLPSHIQLCRKSMMQRAN